MNSWIATFTGTDLSAIPEGAEVRLVWSNAPQSWHVFLVLGGLLALVLFVIQMYRVEAGQLARPWRLVLASLRITALLVLAAVFLAPALAFTHQRVLQPVVVLLRDTSQSMQQRDAYPDDLQAAQAAEIAGMDVQQFREAPPTRSELLQLAWNRGDRRALQLLEQRGRLRIMNFAGDVELVETRAARQDEPGAPAGQRVAPLAEVVADGQTTDLHQALSEALSQRLLAAVILATDAQHNNRDWSRDELLNLANKAGSQGVPILVVGTGDVNRPRNLQINEVYADAQAWKDEPFEIQAVLRAQGVAGEAVRLELVERTLQAGDETTSERVVDTRDIQLAAGVVQQRESFTHVATTAGRFGFSVRAVPLDGELSTDDNQPRAPVEVKVIDEQSRVLLVAGTPTWEYRAVRQLLDREKSINLSCWLQSLDTSRAQEGNTVIQELPHTETELFQYDVILMFDPNPQEFDDAWMALLKQFVDEHAGGFFYMAGPLHASRFLSLPRTTGIKDVLPVRLGDVSAMEVASLLESNNQQWPLAVVAANLDQPIMRMFPERTKTNQIWQQFPGIYWSFPVASATPTGRVLIEHSDPGLRRFTGARPLLVTGNYGAGRTVFMGFNGSWRWRQSGENAEYFNRFWLQTTRFLVEGRSVEGKRRGIIETDQFRYEVGDRVGITAVLKNEQFDPLEVEEVTATLRITGQDDQPIVLRGVANQPGRYAGTVVARNTGRHIVAVNVEQDSTDSPQIETTWTVTMPSVETEQTWLDKPLLRELADASGGDYFELQQLDQIAEAVPERKQTIGTEGRPIPLWDTNRVLLVLVLLLGCEWALRKRLRLL